VKYSGKLEDAQYLATFANLDPKNVQAVQAFRDSYPDFFHRTFWPDGRHSPLLLATEDQFGTFNWKDYQRLVRKAWKEGFSLAASVVLVSLSNTEQDLELVMGTAQPYQRAVMFLHTQPWAARICAECGSFFVADHPKRKYCSIARANLNGAGFTNCSKIRINSGKQKWWNEAGKAQRAAKAKRGK
jgi:hypothetical protein